MQLAQNNRIHLEYIVTDKFEAGLELFGHEVKSIKSGGANLSSSRIILRGGEAYAIGVKVQPYQASNLAKTFEENRTIKILLRKKEIKEMYNLSEDKKLALIPSKLFTHNNLIKMEVSVCKKMNKHDKRDKIKERDMSRDIMSESAAFRS